MSDKHGPLSCAACGELACPNSYAKRGQRDSGGITAYLLDEVWPEYQTYTAQNQKPDDQILAPGLFGRAAIRRYDWLPSVAHKATLATLLRHLAMHRVKAQSGTTRQKAYLHHNDRMAESLARHLNYTANHLVISQDYLPWFARSGLLGGRSYDVLMTRYPFAAIHDKLNALAAKHPTSQTIADYRADQALVDTETRALEGARHIITPHHGIASLFPKQTHRLDWHLPPAQSVIPGKRVAFIGPAIARQGAHWVKDVSRTLPEPLIVFGNDLESSDFWDDIRIERRAIGPQWLNDIGMIIHPAAMTNQPRRLLEAWGSGVQIYATPEAGLAPHQYLSLDDFTTV